VEVKNTEATKKEKPGFWSRENLVSLAILLLAVLAVRWSVASPYVVPTASMEPSIKVGDRLLAWKLAYELKVPFTSYVVARWADPRRGDIIVFRYPQNPSIDYVKRIVGLPGDTVQIIDDVLYLNGKAQEQTDHNSDRSVLDDIDDQKDIKFLARENLDGFDHWVMRNQILSRDPELARWPFDGSGAYTVPADSFLVIGDNRDNSLDSRFWGPVPRSYIHGKGIFVIWSFNPPKGEGFFSGLMKGFRWYRFGAGLR
jgi:signal peptidase I